MQPDLIQSIDPETGAVIEQFTSEDAGAVAAKVAVARRAQPGWARTPYPERAAIVRRFAALLGDHADALSAVIQRETGKRSSDAAYEIDDLLPAEDHPGAIEACIRDMGALIEGGARDLSHLLPGGLEATTARLRFVPHGVVGMIMPWNFPLWIPTVNIIPALLAGNAVLFKPSEYATRVGLELARLLIGSGLPEGVFQTVIGGKTTGEALARAGLDQLWLTGSVRAGLSVQAAMGLNPVELELGGNSAALICDDAPLETAIAGVVWGATYNAGQSCSGIKRVLVQRAIAEPFIDGVVRAVEALRAGRDYGPLIRAAQRDQTITRIETAVHDGARILTGGAFPDGLSAEQRNGFWLSPCVLLLNDLNTPLVQEETFANVVPIVIVEDDEQAIALANATEYGLSAAVWSRDVERAVRIGAQLDVGMVFINEVEVALLYGEAWRGWKRSGIAGAGSKLERCFRQQLTVLHTGTRARDYWFPY